MVDRSPRHLRKLLEDLDILNTELARYCQVSEASVYRWLNGTTQVPAPVIRMLELMQYVNQGREKVRV